MRNLLKETKEVIEGSKHKAEDIVFIGSVVSGYSCTWEEFQVLADYKYDGGYGGQYVARDLVIIFSDGTHLERGEYDGSEWWEYRETLKIPKKQKKIKSLFCGIDNDCCARSSLQELTEGDCV